jgi:hypothetical protein
MGVFHFRIWILLISMAGFIEAGNFTDYPIWAFGL